MTIVILQIVLAVIGVISLLLQRPKDKYAETQENRQDIEDGNITGVESVIDKLLVGTDNSITREPSAEDVEKRISQL